MKPHIDAEPPIKNPNVGQFKKLIERSGFQGVRACVDTLTGDVFIADADLWLHHWIADFAGLTEYMSAIITAAFHHSEGYDYTLDHPATYASLAFLHKFRVQTAGTIVPPKRKEPT